MKLKELPLIITVFTGIFTLLLLTTACEKKNNCEAEYKACNDAAAATRKTKVDFNNAADSCFWYAQEIGNQHLDLNALQYAIEAVKPANKLDSTKTYLGTGKVIALLYGTTIPQLLTDLITAGENAIAIHSKIAKKSALETEAKKKLEECEK